MLSFSDPMSTAERTVSAHLPEPVRHHLGTVLRELYAAHLSRDVPPPMHALLVRLSDALAEQSHADAQAFEIGMLSAVHSLRAFAISLAGKSTEADDLVQETLLRAWENRDRFTPGTNLDAWLFTILRNHFYSVHRKRRREVEDDEGQYAALLSVAPQQDHGVSLIEVQAALTRLPPDMRETLVLVGVHELTYEQVAAISGVAIGTIKSRVHRARTKLTELLGFSVDELRTDALFESAMASSRRPRE